MARQAGPAAAVEQVKHIVQTLRNLPWAEQADPGGCQLNRQGDAIQPAADIPDRHRVPFPQLKASRCRLGPFHEQGDGFRLCQVGHELIFARQGQRGHAINLFPIHPQHFPTGRQDAQALVFSQQERGQASAGLDQVFAVIQDQEQFLAFQIIQ